MKTEIQMLSGPGKPSDYAPAAHVGSTDGHPVATTIADGLMAKEDKTALGDATSHIDSTDGHPLATTIANGLMAAADKVKTGGLVTGIAVHVPDPLRASVENATGGRCTVLYDDLNIPSYMHIIPAMNAGDLFSGMTGLHPAFLVNTVKIGQVFIGMYPASIIGSRAYSLPRVAPAHTITFDAAKAACTAKGTGWHLMTNWEWAAVALWCMKNGFQPRGNTNHGRHHTNVWETGIRQDAATYLPGDTSGVGNTLTGSGPNSWRHNGDPNGIADLVGNVWEWTDGLKINNGQIYMPPDNNVALAEASWTAMDHYLSNESSVLTLKNTSATVVDASLSVMWSSLTKAGGYTESDLLKLALVSPAGLHPTGTLYANASGERVPIRGGARYYSGGAGLAALYLHYGRGKLSTNIGFRPAFVTIP